MASGATGHEKSLTQGTDHDNAPNISCAMLPLEIWQEIAAHLYLHYLLAFGLVSKLCCGATSLVLRYPHVCGHRLVAVLQWKPKLLLDEYRFLRA
jgi:hypothetical protein